MITYLKTKNTGEKEQPITLDQDFKLYLNNILYYQILNYNLTYIYNQIILLKIRGRSS